MSNKKNKKSDENHEEEILLDDDFEGEGSGNNLADDMEGSTAATTTTTTTKAKEPGKRSNAKNKVGQAKKPKQGPESEEENGDNEIAQGEKKSFKPFLTIDDGGGGGNISVEEDPTHLVNVKSVDQCE